MTRRTWTSVLLLLAAGLLIMFAWVRSSPVPDPADIVRVGTVTAEMTDTETSLVFKPQSLVYDGGSWAHHDTFFAIGTDDYIQTFEIYDVYEVEEGRLVPTEDAAMSEYTLSDENLADRTFTVVLGDLPVGVTTVSFEIPVTLEPQPRNADILESRQTVASANFTYDVIAAETSFTGFCQQAIHLLSSESIFTAAAYVEAASAILPNDQMARVEAAAVAYDEGALDGVWDPNEFFELTEEFCGVSLPERWITMS